MKDPSRPPIFDGHNDVIHKLHDAQKGAAAFFTGLEKGHLDYPRALEAGFAGGFFAVYVPNPDTDPDSKARLKKDPDGYRVTIAPPLGYEYAHRSAKQMIERLHRLEEASQGKLSLVTRPQGLERCIEEGIMAAVVHLEGAEPILPSLENLDDFYRLGVRSIGITWSRENAFGCGVPFQIPASPDTGPGLKPPGKSLVRRCNELGIMIDLAHLNEKGFWDVAQISDAPLVSSHTAAHALIPRTRNLTDRQLQAIADTEGLVGVTFSVNDLDGELRPKNDAPLSALIRHLRYITDLIGIDHVAFGSDLDGTTIPSEIGDVTGFQRIRERLREAGFTNTEMQKICYQNWLRVLNVIWDSG